MALKHVGFFREVREQLRETTSGLPALRDAVRPTAQPEEDRVVAYLKGGVCLWAAGCYMPDVLDPSRHVLGSPDYMTDGVWLWPGELAYYVAEYHAELPNEFLAHMRGNGWLVPDLSEAHVTDLCDEVATGWRV